MSGKEEEQAGGHSFMRRHWTDTLFAVAALFVSAISLWVGIRTEDANEQLIAANTWPFLQVMVNNATPEGKENLQFNVVNTGVGPAKVESFEVFYKGKPVRGGNELAALCCGYKKVSALSEEGRKRTKFLIGTVQGMVLRSGEQESFIIYPLGDDNLAVWNALDHARKDITYRLCFCSVLDKCWRSSLTGELSTPGQLHPEQVKTCPVPSVAYTD
ncbi:MAG: hypothetical protein ACTHPD_08475 [Rhizomicrobium sp.]